MATRGDLPYLYVSATREHAGVSMSLVSECLLCTESVYCNTSCNL